MEVVPPEEISKDHSECFYLPHHCVFKESSTTTKLRVVFDGSAKTTSGVSLNDILSIGPKLQDDLFEIFLRFRAYPIALTGDIEKMYRQVVLDTSDKDFHRILWRFSPDEPIQVLRMQRVTYGVVSSMFHSIKSVQSVLESTDTPEAASKIKNDMYVDDLTSGTTTVEKARMLRDEISSILSRGSFTIRKWASNSAEVMDSIPPELRENSETIILNSEEDYTVKTLGFFWKPQPDTFNFKVTPTPDGIVSRRKLLSDTAKIFDPLGWLSPVIIILKIMLQKCWVLGTDWDSQLPDDFIDDWRRFRDNMPLLDKLCIPRCVIPMDFSAVDDV